MEEQLQSILNPILRRIPLCKDLSVVGYKNLIGCVAEKSVPKDTYLFHENDPGDFLYIIKSGEVEILQQQGRLQAAVLKELDFFGEMALLKGNIRNSSARTLTDSTFYVISQECFQHLLVTDPEFATGVSQAYVRRFRKNEQEAHLRKKKDAAS